MTRITGTLHEDQYTYLIISRSVLLKMRNVSDIVVDKAKTHTYFMLDNFYSIIVSLWDNVEKYCTAGQATDGNMAHVHYMLDT